MTRERPGANSTGFFVAVQAKRVGYIPSTTMTVTVLLFASYADALGQSAIELDVAPGSTVRDILGTLCAMPGGDRLPPRPLVAVNQEYASASTTLQGGEEVAVIPPVAGG
jgi:molybdopterin converting factor subunit 1